MFVCFNYWTRCFLFLMPELLFCPSHLWTADKHFNFSTDNLLVCTNKSIDYRSMKYAEETCAAADLFESINWLYIEYNRLFSASDTEGLALEATDFKRASVMTGTFAGLLLSTQLKTSWTAASCASERRAWRSAPLNPSVIRARASKSTSVVSCNCRKV